MTYALTNQKSILFGGGSAAFQTENKTWIFDSITTEWEKRVPNVAPPSREAFGFAYDSMNEKGILFGGLDGNRDFLNDTWAYDYDSNTWEKMGELTENSQVLLNLYLFMIAISVAAIFIIVIYVFVKKRFSIT
jgi:hypothetical protein